VEKKAQEKKGRGRKRKTWIMNEEFRN
jgi:hypothetical protein